MASHRVPRPNMFLRFRAKCLNRAFRWHLTFCPIDKSLVPLPSKWRPPIQRQSSASMDHLDPVKGSEDPDVASKYIGRVFPNIWIGNLASVSKIASVYGSGEDEDPVIQWTIITVVSDELLIRLCQSMIEKLPGHITVNHVLWRLADDPGANFLCEDLLCVLDAIDSCTDTSESGNSGKGESKQACLVHCAKGVSRSAAVCAAWLISRQGLSLSDAMDRIRHVRPQALPNLGFLAALRAIEQCEGDIVVARARLDSRREVSV